MTPRDNLKGKYPRCHYNKLGKTKQSFNTIKEAQHYIDKWKLDGYIIYKCTYCNKYHYGRRLRFS